MGSEGTRALDSPTGIGAITTSLPESHDPSHRSHRFSARFAKITPSLAPGEGFRPRAMTSPVETIPSRGSASTSSSEDGGTDASPSSLEQGGVAGAGAGGVVSKKPKPLFGGRLQSVPLASEALPAVELLESAQGALRWGAWAGVGGGGVLG